MITEATVDGACGEILTNKMDAHNTFDNPNNVHTVSFTDFHVQDGKLTLNVPACSVLHMEITLK